MRYKFENHLFRERQSDSVDFWLSEISKLENGETQKHTLTPDEIAKLDTFESDLTTEWQSFAELKSVMLSLDLDFLQTEPGITAFRKIFGSEIKDEEIANWMLMNPEIIQANIDAVENEIEKKSQEFQMERVVNQLKSRINSDGTIGDTSDIDPPNNFGILVNTEQMAEKITAMRATKNRLKALLSKFSNPGDNLEYAKRVLVEIYLKRINVSIAKFYLFAKSVKEKSDKFGYANLSVSEKTILSEVNLSLDHDVQLTKIDKFIFGASREVDEATQNYNSLSSDLLSYAKHLDELRSKINIRESIERMGLDPEKVLEKNISPDDLKKFADVLLEKYGLISSTSQPWKYEIKKRRTFSVQGEIKTINGVNIPRNILDVMSVLLGHEIEGHVLQHENSSKIPLKIFSEFDGGGRSSLFAEGGAMYMQDKVTRELFGFENLPKTSYIKTLAKRLSGGNFIDCMKVYFESTNAEDLADLTAGKIDKQKYDEIVERNLKTAVSSTKRIFKYGDLRKSRIGISTNSKDLAYLEQKRVLDKMAGTPFFKLAFVSGMNLETAHHLIDLGLLKLEDIKEPRTMTADMWTEIKDNYKLHQ